MSSRDLHAALKTQIAGSAVGTGIQFVVASLQDSKDDIRYSLHAAPNSHTTAGIQTTDYLAYLGFGRGQCAFVNGECYSRSVPAQFDVSGFAVAFSNSYSKLEEAEKHLDKCGIFLPQPEGWGYFYGKPSGTQGHRHALFAGGSDGHTAPKSQQLKIAEDEYFHFTLSFLSGGPASEKGWVYHYHPKHPPASPEIQSVFQFFNVRNFGHCPIFDFEPCYWRFIEFDEREDDMFEGRTHAVHEWFGAHAEHFSHGIENLLEAQRIIGPFNVSFLPVPKPASTVPNLTSLTTTELRKTAETQSREHEYDVAISFAGTEREYAEKLATLVRAQGFEVFYDNFYPEQLWGKDLVVVFDDIYRKESRYCVIFVSQEYCSRMWTNHECRSAQARMLAERGNEYILPIRVDDAELPGLAPTVAHLSLTQFNIEQIGEFLVKKLQSTRSPEVAPVHIPNTDSRGQIGRDFVRVSLMDSGIANFDLSIYRNPPFGDYAWFGVPFKVQNARISMADKFDSQSKLLNFVEPITGVQAVHFLINAGDGRKRYLGREIGSINFIFEQDEPPQSRCPVTLGKNVREWAIGNFVEISETDRRPEPLVDTVEDDNSHEAWRGETHHGQVAVMDMLSVKIDAMKHPKRLLGIEFTRSIPRNTIALDYFVSGITIEASPVK